MVVWPEELGPDYFPRDERGRISATAGTERRPRLLSPLALLPSWTADFEEALDSGGGRIAKIL